MLKESYNLVENDLILLGENYTRYDIVNLIELSYQFAKGGLDLPQEILDNSFDGINTWGLFVKFCYDELLQEKNDDFFDYTDEKIKELMIKFKEKYYNNKGKDDLK